MYHGTCQLGMPRVVLTFGIEAEVNLMQLPRVLQLGMKSKGGKGFMDIQISHCVNQSLRQLD